MRNRSYLWLLGAVAIFGCACDPVPPITIDIGPTDVPMTDTPPPVDARRDTPDTLGMMTGGCGTTGQVGGLCRTGGTCASPSMCRAEIAPMAGESTIRSIFNIGQGVPDPMNPGYFLETMTPDPANDVRLAVFTGDICTSACDTRLEFMETAMTGERDTCGDCAACGGGAGQLGLAPAWVYLPVAERAFGTSTGVCRADCTFDPAGFGTGCPMGHTCNPGTLTCIEACTTDNECRLVFENTRAGDLVTTVAGTGTCNTMTGRCDFGSTLTESTGDACEGAGDCSEDVGLCIRGGMCAEFNCGFASDTMMGGICDNGRGVCLNNGAGRPGPPDPMTGAATRINATICIGGCRTADDCEPGNACIQFGTTMPIGPMMWTGYCLGICDTVMSDAMDEIINCGHMERCDMDPVTATDPDPDGTCRPTCTMATEGTVCDTMLGERCEMEPAPATYGFCRIPDQICSNTLLDEACYFGQTCDLLGFEGNFGLCVDRCTGDPDCTTAGEECDVARGLCRLPCTVGGTECGMGEICRDSYCEQNTTM